jgi:hypothetical protein
MYDPRFLNLGTSLEVRGKFQISASPPPPGGGEELPVPITCRLEAGWSPDPVWAIWGSENSWFYRDSNSDPCVVQPVASRYFDYAIAAISEYY